MNKVKIDSLDIGSKFIFPNQSGVQIFDGISYTERGIKKINYHKKETTLIKVIGAKEFKSSPDGKMMLVDRFVILLND